MVEIVTGSGLGLQESSASVLGSRGRVGSGRLGQDELRVAVNAANGNLVIQGQDEVLLGVGLDESIFNTYNSQGTFTANGWQESYQRHVGGLTGTVNTAGSTITHYASDGSAIVYTYNGTKGLYVGDELGGANDTLSFNSTTNRWSWTDGQSRSIEIYDNANGGRLLSSSDADGNLLSYSYTGSQLTRITTANGEYTDFTYTGSLLTALVTSYTNASGLHSLARVRYGYDTSNRLTTTTVDLDVNDNLISNPRFQNGRAGWDAAQNISGVDVGVDLNSDWSGSGYDSLFTHIAGNTSGGLSDNRSSFINVSAGQTYKASVLAAQHRGVAQALVEYYDANHNIIGSTYLNGSAKESGAWHGDPNNYNTLELTTVAPSGAVYARLNLRLASNGGTDPYAFFEEPSFRQVTPTGNSIADGHIYVTSYGYDGTSNRISSITQKDSDGVTLVKVDVTYVQVGSAYAVSTVSQATLNNTTTSTTNLSYDVANRRTTITDALGNQSVMVYDTSGRLTQLISPPLVSGGAQQAESFVYNSNGDLLYSGPTGDPNFTNIGLNWNDLYQSSNTVSTTQSTEVDGGVNVYRRQSTTTPPSGWVMRLGQSQQAWSAVSAGQTVNLKAYVSSTGASHIELYAIFRDVNGTAISSLSLNFPSVGGMFGANGVASANLASGLATTPVGAAYVELMVQAIADGTGPLNVAIAQPSVAVGGTPAAGSIPPAYNYAYDGNGNRTSMTDALGNQTLYTYDTNNQLLTATEYADASTPMTTRYVYDGESHLIYTISPLGAVTKYIYNTAGQQTSVIEYTSVTHLYNVAPLSTSTSPSLATMDSWSSSLTDLSTAKRTDMVYDARGALSSVTTYAKTTLAGLGDTSTASTTTYIYDQAGLLLSKVLPGSSATEVYLYDGLGRTLSFKDFSGKITQSAYSSYTGADFTGAKVVTTMANGTIQTSLYDLAGDLKKVTVSGSGGLISSTTYTYDRLSRLVKTTDATGSSNYFVYDAQGHKVADVDADGSLTVYRYNANDQVISTTSYATKLSAAQITSLGSVIESTATAVSLSGLIPTASANDRWGWNVYDFDGRLVETIDATGAVTAYAYDKASRLLSTTSYATLLSAATVTGFKTTAPVSAVLPTANAANDRVVRNLYNIDGQLVGVLDADGYLTQTVYDGAGQSVKTIRYATQAASNLWATGTFADLKTSVGTSAADIHNWSVYDNAGLLRAVIDGEGNATRYDNYTGAGSVGKVTRGQWISPATLIATPPTFASLPVASGTLEITTYTYDQYGHVLTQSLALSDGVTETTTYSYDASYNLIKQSTASINTVTNGADGRTSTVRYDSLGRKVAQLSGVGSAALAALGATPTQAQIDGVWAQYQETYAYDAAGRLISQTDPNGNRTLFYYNSDGQLAYQIDATGAVVGYSYNAFGEKTDVTAYAIKLSTTVLAGLVGGQVVVALTSAIQTSAQDSHSHVDFNIDGTVADTIDALGVTTNYAYNAFGEMTGRTDPVTAGVVRTTSKTYSRRGLLMSSTADVGGLALTTSYQYDAFGRTTQVTDPTASVRKTTYDRAGHVLTQVDALNQSTVFTYDSLGHVLTVTDRTGAITSYVYNKLFDRQVTVSDAAGSTIKTVNAYGETIKVVDGVGTITTYSYDADGHVLTQVVDNKSGGLNLTTQYTYDKAGNLIIMTDPIGAVTRYIYDGDNRQTYVIAPTGAVTGYSYDAFGQVVLTRQYAAANTSTGVQSLAQMQTWGASNASDANDRITRAVYDVAGRQTYSIDATGSVTSYVYDAEGRVLQSTQYAVAYGNAAYEFAKAAYQVAFNRTADYWGWMSWGGQLDSGSITQLGLVQGLVASLEFQTAISGKTNAQIVDYLYNAAFGRTSSGDATAAGYVTQLNNSTLTVANLVLTLVQSGESQAREAKLLGAKYAAQLPTAPVGSLQVTRSVYDAEGRQTYSIDATGAVTSYVYDAEGRVLLSTQYAARNTTTGVQSLAQMQTWLASNTSAVNDRVTRSVYDAEGRQTYSIDATGAVTSYVYDAEGRVLLSTSYAALNTTTGVQTPSQMQTWVTSNANAVNDLITRSVYDTVGRLSYSIDATGAVTGYVYDAEGRVLKSTQYAALTITAGIKTLSDMQTWLASNTSAVNDRITRSVYDATGRQTYSIDATGSVTSYVYDAAGRVLQSTQYAVAYGNAAYEFTKAAYQVAFNRTADYWGWMSWGGQLDSGVITQLGLIQGLVASLEFQTAISGKTKAQIVDYLYNAAFGRTSSGDATAAGYVTQLTNGTLTLENLVLTLVQSGESQAREAKLLGAKYAAQLPTAPVGSLRVTRSVYDAEGRQTYSIDATGAVTSYVYDAEGRVLKSTQYAARNTTTGAQTSSQMQAWITSNASATNDRVTRSVYDTVGRLSYAIDATGAVTKYVYDSAGRVLKSTQYGVLRTETDIPSQATMKTWAETPAVANAANNHQTVTVYDIGARTTTTTDALGIVTKVAYNIFGEKQDVTVAFGSVDAVTTHWEYEKVGRLLSQTTAYGTSDAVVVSFSYDAFGNRKTATDGNGKVTTYSYDKEGRVLTKTEPTGTDSSPKFALTVNTYNAFGDLVKVTDPNNNSGYFYYDGLGRKTWQVDPQGYVTKTTYDNSGNILSTTRYAAVASNLASVSITTPPTVTVNALDNTTTFTRDGEGRVLTSTDGENNVTAYTYNVFGDRISMTNAENATVTYSYDVRGLMLSQVTPATVVGGNDNIAPASTTAYVYDVFGNRTQMIEAQGRTEQRTTTYVYDKNNQLTSQIGDAVTVTSITGGTSTVTPTQSFTYDLRGNQTSTIDANGARTVTYYDRQDRATAQVNALGGLSTWGYDKNGNLLSQRVYGTALSLPVSIGTVPVPVNASNVRETKYTYDQANRRLTTSLVGAVSGKWVSDANPWASPTGVLTYDGNGKPIRETDANGNVIREIDANGNSTYFYTSTTAYDNNGNVIRETDANGNSTYYYYDKLGRKTAQIDPSGYLTTYTLDAEGNVTLQVQYATALSGTFTGGATQPTAPAASANDRVTSFVYNHNGQRTRETRSGVTYSTVTGNTIATTTGDVTIQFEYNKLGQVTKKIEATGDTTTYLYDKLGRVARMTTATGAITQSTYDGLGNLTATVAGFGTALSATTFYIYGAGGRLTAKVDAMGASLVYSIGLAATDAMGYVTSYGYDANGNTTVQSYTRLKSDGTSVKEASLTSYNLLGQVTSTAKGTWNGTSYVTGDTTDSYYNLYGEVVARGVNTGGVILKAQEYADYDAAGRVWRSNMGDGIAKIYGYDANGNTTVQIQGLGTTDLRTLANLNAALSATGVTKTYNIYNGRNELVTVKRPTSVNVDGTISSASTVGIIGQGSIIVAGVLATYGTPAGPVYILTTNLVVVLPSSVVPAANSGTTLSFMVNGSARTPISSSTSNGLVTYTFNPIDGGQLPGSTFSKPYTVAISTVTGGTQTNINNQTITINNTQLVVGSGMMLNPSVAVQNMNPSVTSLQMFVRPSGSTGAYTSITGTQTLDSSGQAIAGAFSAFLPASVTGSVWEVMYLAKDAQGNVLDAKSGTVTYVGTSPVTATASAFKAISAAESNGNWQLTAAEAAVKYSDFTQTFNAFGDTLSQTDSRGGITSFSYNVFGNLIQKSGPQVSVVGENGVATLVNPTDTYYYDKSGRLVGHKDAIRNLNDALGNQNNGIGGLTTQTLLAGSGYGGEAALITAQYNPDGGIVATEYDIFGRATKETDAGGLVTNNTYDKNNRLITASHEGRITADTAYTSGTLMQLVDTYVYDGLGQRIKHTNNAFGASVAETTDYDLQGRVTKSVTFGGQITTYGYVWTAATATSRVSAGQASGGYWTRTVTANGKSSSVSTDDFGKALSSTDLGGHVTTYSYNLAGQVTHQASTAGQSIDYSYTTTGQLARLTDTVTNMVSSYAYDANGNRIIEAYGRTNTVETFEAARITYDALNRVTRITDLKADITYSYDANGNRREVKSVYSANGTAPQTQDYWYKYDSMNRFILTKGSLSNGAITTGAESVVLTYTARGDRATAFYGRDNHTETYTYSPDGYLETVKVNNVLGVKRVTDVLGRLTSYTEYKTDGTSPVLSRAMTYDRDNRVTAETDLSYNNGITYTSTITNDYRAYVEHEVISTTPNAQGEFNETIEWRYDGDDLGVLIHTKNVQTQSGSGASAGTLTTNTDYNYVWWSQAKTSSTTITGTDSNNANSNQWAPGNSANTYDVNGNLIEMNDGQTSGANRKIKYIVDSFGQVMTRQETNYGLTGAQRTFFYLNGRTIGDMGTDKLASSIDYAQQLVDDRAAAAATAGAATYSTNATPVVGLNANFDASYVAYNASTVTQAGSSYTVNDGDSLASIALSVWGDASLWYVIADANGLEADANLVAGQSLILPDKVVNLHNTSQTFKPYNPNDALGDTTPTLPKEPQPPAPKKQGCGVGQIIVAIVAIAVTLIVAPAAVAAVANLQAGATLGASLSAAAGALGSTASAGLISGVASASVATGTFAAIAGGAIGGAIGGIVSQGFAVATGIQSKFNWTAVATAAIGGGVGGAFTQGSGFIEAVKHGMVTNAVSQGVNMAVGLQKKFDWTSVAVAGVGSGVSSSISGWAGATFGRAGGVVVTNTASLLANAATKSLITGQDFGKSIREGLPDAIASTVGNMIAGAVKSKIEEAQTKTPAQEVAEAKSNGLIIQKPDLSAFETPNLVDKYRVSKLDLNAVAPWSGKYTLESGQTITDISRASLLAQGYTKDQITQALILKQNLAIMADNNISNPSRLPAGTKLTVREIGADRDPALLKIASRNYGRDNAAVQQRRAEIAAARAAAKLKSSDGYIFSREWEHWGGGFSEKCTPWDKISFASTSSASAFTTDNKYLDWGVNFMRGGGQVVVETGTGVAQHMGEHFYNTSSPEAWINAGLSLLGNDVNPLAPNAMKVLKPQYDLISSAANGKINLGQIFDSGYKSLSDWGARAGSSDSNVSAYAWGQGTANLIMAWYGGGESIAAKSAVMFRSGKVSGFLGRFILDESGTVPLNFTKAAGTTGSKAIIATDRGVAMTPELLELQGTSSLAGDFRGIQGATIEDIISRVPSDWTLASQQKGMGIRFFDDTGLERLRLHGPSMNAPAGSNSAAGWTARVQVPGTKNSYFDNHGNVVGFKANEGHIPIYGNSNAGY